MSNPEQGATPGDSGAAAVDFEQALARLESIIHDLEEGQVGLADSLSRYEEGVKLLRQCYGVLEKAERRIELCTGIDAEGNPITETFDDTASGLSGEEQSQARSRRRSQAAKSPRVAKPSTPAVTKEDESDEERGLF